MISGRPGFGDYDMWYAVGIEEEGQVKHVKIKEVINRKITGPTDIFILNEKTRESYRIGMRNEMFSKGPIKYVGKEIRAVIMSLLGVDSQDTICLVDAESIAIEAAFVASDGAIICVENDKGAKDTMEDNVKRLQCTTSRSSQTYPRDLWRRFQHQDFPLSLRTSISKKIFRDC